MKKPIISIVIPTLCRGSLYPLLNSLLKQKINSGFEIVLVPQGKLNSNLLIKNDLIKIFPKEPNLGFSYYRNFGVLKSVGKVIVFIDDDEMPKDFLWLNNITRDILNGNEKVCTAGVEVKLGEGYFTDSISLLGFPGGGAVGFKTMWFVDNNNYTNHLCVGNLAIEKNLLLKIGSFKNILKSGNEDVDLADRLISKNIKIKYIENATVYHVARGGLINFIKWNMLRGRSAKQYSKIHKSLNGNIANRLKSSSRILKKVVFTKYIFGVIFFMANQYLWQTYGYVTEKQN